MQHSRGPSTHNAPYILLVEDDEVTTEVVKEVISSELRLAVETASDGVEAFELLLQARRSPALIIVDLGLPRLDGESFIGEVRRRFGPDAPIMLMSAMEAERVFATARRIGALSVLTKPFEIATLLAQVRAALAVVKGEDPPQQLPRAE